MTPLERELIAALKNVRGQLRHGVGRPQAAAWIDHFLERIEAIAKTEGK